MISVSQADSLLLELVEPRLHVTSLPLSKCVGRVLQDPILADRPYPPFDRICMDGISIDYRSYKSGITKWPKYGLQKAGDVAMVLPDPHQCIEVMTGTLCPTNSDTCLRYEDLIDLGDSFELKPHIELKQGQNIHPMGTDYAKDEVLVESATLINSTHIGIAASVGLTALKVFTQPRVALLSTGDELITQYETPLPHQIYRSNSQTLVASLKQFGFDEIVLDRHVLDESLQLSQSIVESLNSSDILILTGGFSAGKFDLVPDTLKSLGVREVFHKVSHRPGKPLWVGIGPQSQIVFGLPGNPVSALVCYRRFILPFLQLKSGLKTLETTWVVLSSELTFKPNLTWFLPVKRQSQKNGQLVAIPKPTRGSGDFCTLGLTDGFIELPSNQTFFAAGSSYPFYSWT